MNYIENEHEIDPFELVHKVWAGRKLILKVCCATVVMGLVISFSIPKEYTTAVVVGAVNVLGHAHAPKNHRAFRRRVEAGGSQRKVSASMPQIGAIASGL